MLKYNFFRLLSKGLSYLEGWINRLNVKLKLLGRLNKPLNIIIGAGTTKLPGWIATDIDILNVCDERDWKRCFDVNSIDLLLSEHVFEHLSEDECRESFLFCFKYLKTGGNFRIAVPDGNRDDDVYLKEVSPPKDGHKILFTWSKLQRMLEEAGFQVTLLEWFDDATEFHYKKWDVSRGLIMRSKWFDGQSGFAYKGLNYTSIIIDAKKVG